MPSPPPGRAHVGAARNFSDASAGDLAAITSGRAREADRDGSRPYSATRAAGHDVPGVRWPHFWHHDLYRAEPCWNHRSGGEHASCGTRCAYRAEQDRLAPYREVARKVILLRTRHRISQEELARRVGTSKSAMVRLESGRHRARGDAAQGGRRVWDATGDRIPAFN
jgi:hypothetical protein